MKTLEEIAGNESVNEELDVKYDIIIEEINKAKAEHLPIDEGLFKAVVGAAGAAVFGPSIMEAICKVLGIDVKGPLGNLMTSRLILTACAAKLGWKA